LFDPIEEPFDLVASAVKVRAETDRIAAIAFRGDVGPRPLFHGQPSYPVGIDPGFRRESRFPASRTSWASPVSDKQGAVEGVWSYAGRNVYFGVREHGMGAILNGLAAHGSTVPFGATFLIFSDYMRPPIRLAAMMKLHVIYVFTHDSIALGQDGSTHQPVEQLAGLRAVPGLTVIRPGDANETAVAWRVALEARDHPIALVLTRQNVPTLDRAQCAAADGLRQGAYVLADAANGRPDLILIATGSEVGLIMAARQTLQERNVMTRVVSMPSWDLFDAQPRSYRDQVFLPAVHARLAVEAGASQGWHRYVGDRGDVLGVDRYGASAPGDVVMREYGFTVDNVCKKGHDAVGVGTYLDVHRAHGDKYLARCHDRQMKRNGKLPRPVAPRAISSDTAALGVDEDVSLLALLECPLHVDSGSPSREFSMSKSSLPPSGLIAD
jgi:Transketolase, pyrimidine binding domain/Transketolase-like TK C-terminal domain